MRPWNAWLYGLGLSGVLALGLAGCGGGDVPEPSAEDLAAADEAEAAPAEPAPPEDAAAAVAAAPAPAPTPPAGPAASAPGEAPAPVAAAPPTPDAAAGAVKSDTAELLAMATGAAAPAESAPAPGATAPAPAGEIAPEPGAGDLMTPPGFPGGPGGPGGEMGARGPGFRGGEDGSSGIPGGLGLGGAAGSNDPGDTNSAHGAVKAFLHAIKNKDRGRLSEATALRANSDQEGGKYRELFARIIDESISETELDDLATKLDGYVDAGDNQVKSTGRLGVTIRKTLDDGGWLQRTVTVRKEKKGWGVLDISSPTEFKSPSNRGATQRR
ncbi:hypothetical protein [Paludisphaera soli]|uniref:hypothetical protein n=1 Tax=Paludisphaera soli TaxID=2712865 RepID=UPI0013ED6A21|nr:hypothetical protein [Paludisphaera soli]